MAQRRAGLDGPAQQTVDPGNTDRDNARAQLLSGVIWLLIIASGGYEIFQVIAGVSLGRIAAVGLVLAAGLTAHRLLHRGHLVATGWVIVGLVFTMASYSLWLAGGVDAPGATTYLVVVLMASMVLGARAAAGTTLLALAALSLFAVAESRGALPEMMPRRAVVELWAIAALHVAATGWLTGYAAHLFDGVLARLERRNVDLAESEARYARLLEQSPDVIVSLDSQGVIAECSAPIERVFGYRPEDVVGRPFLDLGVIPDEDLPSSVNLLGEVIDKGGASLPTVRIRHADGSFRWVEASVRVVDHDDGSVHLNLVVRDVTARHEAEEQRETLQLQLEEARRLEALGRLAGGVAHDFNNLLLVISANTEIIERTGGTPEAALGQIRVAREAAADLIRQLLAFSGQTPQADMVVDVGATITRIEGLLRRLVPPPVELRIVISDEAPPTRFASTQLEQVTVNLVMNAVQALAGDGRITIEVAPVDDGEFVLLAVEDNGRGMSESTLERVFEPFYSERAGGTGLGLASVHGSVTQHGGRVRVHSAPGEGSRFEVLLPAAVPEPAAKTPADEDRAVRLDGVRILLVDDEPAVLSSLTRALEDVGGEVFGASSPAEAIALSEAGGHEVDVIVTDVRMPEMTGKELVTRIRAHRPGLAALFMSGYTAEILDAGDLDSPGVGFLAKPFSLDELFAAVGNLSGALERLGRG